MNWEFEHWNDGKVYLHNERWKEFKKNIDKHGYKGSLHDWDHSRSFIRIHTPRDNIKDIPVPGDEDLKYDIQEKIQGWYPIYDPFPVYLRTEHDPEAWLPSWHMYLEDNHKDKEELVVLKTGNIYFANIASDYSWTTNRTAKINRFAFYKNQFWILDHWKAYGMGSNPPPPEIKPVKKKYRNIFEE